MINSSLDSPIDLLVFISGYILSYDAPVEPESDRLRWHFNRIERLDVTNTIEAVLRWWLIELYNKHELQHSTR